jgi:signal transduction histidine kinase
LGLYISKSIVESHGGKIWAKNNADGKGAIFTFSLPVYKKDQ